MNKIHLYGKSPIIILLIAPVALGLWWLILQPVLLPLIRVLAGTSLEMIFSNLDLKIDAQANMNWLMATNLLIEPEPYTRTLQTYMTFTGITIGFPVLWSLCLVFYRKSLIPNLIYGTGYLLLLTSLAVVLKGVYTIYSVMALDNVINQYLEASGRIIPIETISEFKLLFWLTAGNVMIYIVLLVFPLAWCYYANKELISEFLENKRLAPGARE